MPSPVFNNNYCDILEGFGLNILAVLISKTTLGALGERWISLEANVLVQTPIESAVALYSTTLNFPLVEIGHLTRWCLSSVGAYQHIVPVFCNFSLNIWRCTIKQ